MISNLFISKKELKEKIEQQQKDIENLKHSHKELMERYNGLMKNYEQLMNDIKLMCGVQEEDDKKNKKAESERMSFADAISEVFDWGDK